MSTRTIGKLAKASDMGIETVCFYELGACCLRHRAASIAGITRERFN
jgi:hypothetical protein